MEEKAYYKQFDIKVGNRKEGIYNEHLNVNHLFFEKHINDYVSDGNVDIDLTIDCRERMIFLTFDMKGYLISTCDLCLESLTLPINCTEKLILKVTENITDINNNDESIVFISKNDYLYNVEQIIFEYLMMTIPIRKEHSNTNDDMCNQDMLNLLKQFERSNKQDEMGNAMWNALKNIKLEEEK